MTENRAIELLEYIRETGNGEAPYVGCAQNIAIEMAIKALEKQSPKKTNYTKIQYGKHKWKRDKNGEVDDWAWDAGYCNGVVCEVCGDSYCVYCDPDYDELEDCEVEHYNCPTCGEKVGYKSTHCKCGQRLDWQEFQ